MHRSQLVCLLPLLTIGLHCTPVQDRTVGPDDEDLGPIFHESRDVTLEISEDGVIRLRLDAERMLRYDDPDSVHTVFQRGDNARDRVTVVFFDSLGEQTGTLSAETVRFDETDHTMIATGDVVVESTEAQLRSEIVHWNEDEGTIRAPGFVSLMTETENLQGYELDANEDLTRVTIFRPTGTFTIDEQ